MTLIFYDFKISQKTDLQPSKPQQSATNHLPVSLNQKNPDSDFVLKKIVIKENLNNNLTTSEPYIVNCKKRFSNVEHFEKLNQESQAFRKRLIQYLKNSDLESDKLLYALSHFKNKSETNLNLLKQFTEQYPLNQYGQYSFINSCSESPESEQCKKMDNPNLHQVASNNGAIWLSIAIYRMQKMQHQGVIEALQNSLQTPIFDSFYGKHIMLYNEASLASGNSNNSIAKIAAMGDAAATVFPYYGALLAFCKEQDINNTQITELCLNVGEAMTTKGTSLLLNGLGNGIQKSIYQQQGQQQAGKQLDKEKQQLQIHHNNNLFSQTVGLMMYDEILADFWFDAVIQSGELNASKMVVEEAIRLSKNPDYAPCPE